MRSAATCRKGLTRSIDGGTSAPPHVFSALERRRPGGWPGGVTPPRAGEDACGASRRDAGVPLKTMVSVLFPHFDHAAIEERFASWQARTRFRDGGADILPYAPGDRACDVAGEVESTHVVVVTDPLLLPSKNL